MGLKRNVGLFTALRYNGGAPMWTYVLHRIGGVALFIFFSMYILVLTGVSPVNAIFNNSFFQIVTLFLGLFHAINGLRIAILDLWPAWLVYLPQAIRVEGVVLVLVYGFVLFAILGGGSGG
jgi:succinate dehydrogenase / fumarate reductase, cytochrome b subunit